MKLLAFYLPQFHEIPENNKWWGKGFTDWTNVKKAKPLFDGHQQPKEPLNDNYYDLSKIEVMKWQSKIAQEYGIYGFCYYHYWFNGKKLLEKPLENMLKDKDIAIPFCFSWANEPWSRTWDGRNMDVLMPQEYGDTKEWQEHFNYLLDFFKDERYIKIGNKPILLIYRTENIPNINEMIHYWNKLAIENDFNGIYLVETLNSFQGKSYVDNSDAVLEFEPAYTFTHGLGIFDKIYNKIYNKIFSDSLNLKNYDHIWNKILSRSPVNREGKKTILGAFIGWDNSARKGKNGVIMTNNTVEKFEKYFGLQCEKANTVYKSEYIFINAWNEWAEGTYLEPDKYNKYGYLEIIKRLNK